MKKPNFKIGMTAIEVIVEIVKSNPEIEEIQIYEYGPRQGSRKLKAGKKNLDRLLFHDHADQSRLEREDVTVECLQKFADFFCRDEFGNESWCESVLSKIRIKGKTYHIPMMDFCCEISPESLQALENFIQKIGFHGAILTSGKSYHFYGNKLITHGEWFNFIADCGLSGLADCRYIFHRLKDMHSLLRISACSSKPTVPIVVSVI